MITFGSPLTVGAATSYDGNREATINTIVDRRSVEPQPEVRRAHTKRSWVSGRLLWLGPVSGWSGSGSQGRRGATLRAAREGHGSARGWRYDGPGL